ncbi:FKBP-type peptidyl-prolyl cis-trans isomerase [Galenea microaerophila]
MRITNGSHVTFHYELRDEEGNLIESTFEGEPVDYIHGEEQIIEGLEALMEGEEPGFEAKATIPPEKAYGVVSDDLIVYAGPENFDDNVEIKVGETVETEDPEGETIVFRIIEVEEDKVYLDGNHPLAGKTLQYKVEVVDVK